LPLHTRCRVIEAVLNEILGLQEKKNEEEREEDGEEEEKKKKQQQQQQQQLLIITCPCLQYTRCLLNSVIISV